MENIPYASVVGSLMYAQTCTRLDISFAVGMLGRYQSNPGFDHWKTAKKVLRYLQRKKDHMLTYRRSGHLEVIGYTDTTKKMLNNGGYFAEVLKTSLIY